MFGVYTHYKNRRSEALREKNKVFYEGEVKCVLNFASISIFFFERRKPLAAKVEREYQAKLIKRIKELLPGCVVMKNDPEYIQGIPDLTVLYHDKWATLEVKREKNAKHRPNQDYYVGMMDDMSFSKFIYPENEEEVLSELQSALRSDR